MKSDINVTPLIDVLLVLLIIFMIVAPTPPRALDTALPKSGSEGPSPPDGLVLEIRSEGYALNTTPVWTASALEEQLRAAFDTRGDRTLLVKANPELRYHRVVEALDLAHGAGASRIGMLDLEASDPGD
jgi:biopolymer transport protein ExbD